MSKGRGFFAPNTALSCEVTSGERISAEHFRSLRSRVDTVVLSESQMTWREGINRFCHRTGCQNEALAANRVIQGARHDKIRVLSSHKVSGETIFEWTDPDAVGGVVPEVSTSTNYDARLAGATVSRCEMTADEKEALDRLLVMWHRGSSNSDARISGLAEIYESSSIGIDEAALFALAERAVEAL